eukprot:scaffold31_cov334-Pavlova_lutheri.AAC.38
MGTTSDARWIAWRWCGAAIASSASHSPQDGRTDPEANCWDTWQWSCGFFGTGVAFPTRDPSGSKGNEVPVRTIGRAIESHPSPGRTFGGVAFQSSRRSQTFQEDAPVENGKAPSMNT